MSALEAQLLLIAWLVAVVYATLPVFWFLTHPFIERWRKVRRPLFLLAPAWLAVIALAGLATAPYRHAVLYRSGWAWLAAAPLALMAYFIYARVTRSSFDRATLLGQTELEPQREQRLHTAGLHGRMRHPIYAAHLLHLAFWAVGSGTALNLALLAAAVPLYMVMIALEERELVARFDQEYREYQRRVPALLPRARR